MNGKQGKEAKQVMNSQSVICFTFPEFFILEMNRKKQSKEPARVLKINRKSAELIELDKSEVNFHDKTYVFRCFSAFIGLIVLDGMQFLMFCDDCVEATPDCYPQIFQIQNIFMVSFVTDYDLILSGRKRSILKKISDINELLGRGFYYSLDYRITQTRECQDRMYRDEFTWNANQIQEISKTKNIHGEWIVPVIQGFVGAFSCYVEGNKVDYVLISRRSWHKGGTRYFDRGVNEDGWVANFVETEQLLTLGCYVVSDVQIRGSVPIYFEQRGITTKVSISRSNELARQSFKTHFDYLRKKYDRTFCVNLLATGKGGQRTIIDEFERHIRQENDPDIKYMYFDFHKVCGHDFSKVNLAINKVAQQKKNLCVYIVDTNTNIVLGRQMGVFRTNCLDCLDRTNFFQAKLALQTVQNILFMYSVDLKQVYGMSAIQEMDKAENLHTFIRNFKNIWADNGDMISYHYTGTGSTHTDITRQGTRGLKGTFQHKFKTITRFYNQHFWDFDKMRMIQLLLQQSDTQAFMVPSRLKEKQKQYCTFQNVPILVLTWKVSNLSPPGDLLDLPSCSFLIVGLQQVQSTSMFRFKNKDDRIEQWILYFLRALTQKGQDKFILITKPYESNSLLLVFAKEKFKERVGDLQFCTINFNPLTNKNAIVVRMNIDDSEVAFINCQLDYGREYAKSRASNIRNVYTNAFQQEEVGKKKSQLLKDTPTKILFGNLNINLTLDEVTTKLRLKQINNDYNDIKGLIKGSDMQVHKSQQLKQKIKELVKNDEISILKETVQSLRDYQQAEITFIPPYKYMKGKTKIDESKCGGWVDRILYDSQQPITCTGYTAHEIFATDHLPVSALMSIRVRKENAVKKKAVYEQLLSELKITLPPEEEQL